jgi:hypothetical protein
MPAAVEPAMPVMHPAMPAMMVMRARPVMVAMVDSVPAMMVDASNIVEAESQVERHRRTGIQRPAVAIRVRVVRGRRRAVDGASRQRATEQERKYQAFRGALGQDSHGRHLGNTLLF